jgi:hypothetical protein
VRIKGNPQTSIAKILVTLSNLLLFTSSLRHFFVRIISFC